MTPHQTHHTRPQQRITQATPQTAAVIHLPFPSQYGGEFPHLLCRHSPPITIDQLAPWIGQTIWYGAVHQTLSDARL